MRFLKSFDEFPRLSNEQYCLIRALVKDSNEGEAALKEWVEQIDFENLDHSSFRLMPLLFKKYGDGIQLGNHRGRIKGISRYIHYKNSIITTDAFKVVSELHKANIQLMIFKGINLSLNHYGDNLSRAMDDVDILVKSEDVGSAEAAMRNIGWKYRYHEKLKKTYLHSYDYVNARGSALDLHWYCMPEATQCAIDKDIWSRSREVEWLGTNVKCMGPEDSALVSMVNGLREGLSARLEWILDIVHIINSHEHFDWNVVWIEAGNRGLRKTILEAFGVLYSIDPNILLGKSPLDYLESDTELHREYIRKLVAQNRTQTVAKQKSYLLNSFIALNSYCPRNHFHQSEYRKIAASRDSFKCISYELDKENYIRSVYLHRVQLEALGKIFDIKSKQMKPVDRVRHWLKNEGELRLAPEEIRLPEERLLAEYNAEIELQSRNEPLVSIVGSSSLINLRVKNTSDNYWVVLDGSLNSMSVSYHLYSDQFELIEWENPRTEFLSAMQGCASYIPPDGYVDIELKITAPLVSGNYIIAIDIVHENMKWFSNDGVSFPSFALNVIN